MDRSFSFLASSSLHFTRHVFDRLRQRHIRQTEVHEAVQHMQSAFPSKRPESAAWVIIGSNGVAVVVDISSRTVITVYRVPRPLRSVEAS